ncbi:MAG: NifU family protein [Gemmatimonadetes bacterium]|nr:NifU family protein [Gemmatimonadota bacterium]
MLTFTETAREMVLSYLGQPGMESLALRISVNGGSPLAPDYEFVLVDEGETAPEDIVLDMDGFKVVLNAESAKRIEGSTVDYVQRLTEEGFEVRNPNLAPAPRPALNGPLAERVATIISERINPAIAAHGGHIALVDVKENDVYIEMSGGCQGCGMARITLRQGIERMIREALPEVRSIYDVTDHAAGMNPYYQAT